MESFPHGSALVTLAPMASAIVRAVESPIFVTRVVEVPGIRASLPLPPPS